MSAALFTAASAALGIRVLVPGEDHGPEVRENTKTQEEVVRDGGAEEGRAEA
jgi:hypothetical protein